MTRTNFFSRFSRALQCFFRVLGDASFAERLLHAPPRVESPDVERPLREETSAMELLGLFQRQGRFVDFLMQDIATFSDEQIGAAARHVHSGCREALLSSADISPVRSEGEGHALTLEERFDPATVKLTGNVPSAGPYSGTLVHRGWRLSLLHLPQTATGADPHILAQAELEL